MARAKRGAVQRQSHVQFLLEMALMKVPAGERLRRMERRFKEETRAAALEGGYPPALIERMVEEATLTTQTLSRDLRQVMKRLRGGERAAGELLVLERIKQLEVESLHVDMVESKAWEAYEASCGAEVTTTTTKQEAVEIDEPAEGETGPGKKRKVLRPKDVQRQTKNRVADSRFLEIALRCVETRARIGGEIFQLAARLGMSSMVPVEFDRLREGSVEVLQGLLSNELALLYRAEANVVGADAAAERRIKLLQSHLQQKTAESRGGGKGGIPAGGAGVWELRLREWNGVEE